MIRRTRTAATEGQRRRFGNKKTTVDNIEFDSDTEAKYYVYLKAEKAAGRVLEIIVHPKFLLQPGCRRFGRLYNPITYTADFKVKKASGAWEVIDIKGFSTEDAALKRKMFAYRYPEFPLLWIAASKKYSKTGWIDYDELMRIRRSNRRAKQREQKETEGGAQKLF